MKKETLKLLKENNLGLKRGSLSFSCSDKWIAIAKRLKKEIHAGIDGDLEHIGSTAIEGLKAKPIIDFLLMYQGDNISNETIKQLERIGFTYKGDILSKVNKTDCKYGRHFFAFYDDEKTIDFVHIHALPKGDSQAKELITFRDELRDNPSKVELYNRFKQKHADEKTSREVYRIAKSDLVKALVNNTDCSIQ